MKSDGLKSGGSIRTRISGSAIVAKLNRYTPLTLHVDEANWEKDFARRDLNSFFEVTIPR